MAQVLHGQPELILVISQSWFTVTGTWKGRVYFNVVKIGFLQNTCCWNLTKRNNFIRLCNIFYNLLCFPFFPRTFGDNLIYTDWQRDNYFRAVKVNLFPSLAPILLIGEQDHSTLPNHDHFTANLHAQRPYIYGWFFVLGLQEKA